jgi:hypothetical protein
LKAATAATPFADGLPVCAAGRNPFSALSFVRSRPGVSPVGPLLCLRCRQPTNRFPSVLPSSWPIMILETGHSHWRVPHRRRFTKKPPRSLPLPSWLIVPLSKPSTSAGQSEQVPLSLTARRGICDTLPFFSPAMFLSLVLRSGPVSLSRCGFLSVLGEESTPFDTANAGPISSSLDARRRRFFHRFFAKSLLRGGSGRFVCACFVAIGHAVSPLRLPH